MKTPFYTHNTSGNPFLIAFTFILLFLSLTSFGQPEPFTIEGESLWRNQGYGVSNHYFDIKNYIIPYSTEYPLSPDPITGSCPYEFYTTDDMPLYVDNYFSASNTLKIRPYSDNDRADYMNGVTVADIYAIASHIGAGIKFEDRTPEEDAPFRYISADADYDHNLDQDDIDMIEDLILGYRDDLTRNSWEWVLKDEVEEGEERFNEYPYMYDFVIDYNWPGSEGIILAAISTHDILGDNDKYFGFRTTKIADIVGTGQSQASTNDWICGSGYYFTGNEVFGRSNVINVQDTKVRKGSVITFVVYLNTDVDILTMELPLYYPQEDFNLVSIQFADGFNPRWNYNKAINSLVILDYSKNGSPLSVNNGRIVELKLKTNNDVRDIQSEVGLFSKRMVEITGMDENLLQADIQVEITDVLPPDLFIEVRSIGDAQEAYIESPIDQQVTMHLINDQGFVVISDQLILQHGENHMPLDYGLIPGIYLIHVFINMQSAVTKMVIQ